MLIPSEKPGQLANRLVLLSHLTAFSLEYDVIVMLHLLDEYADFFEGPQQGLKIKGKNISHFMDNSKFTRSLLFYFFKKCSRFMRKSGFSDLYCVKTFYVKTDDPDFIINNEKHLPELTSNKVFFLSGWLFRTKGLLEKHRDFIISYFKPLKIFRDRAENVVLPLKNDFKTVVGIHIRRGDYKNFLGGKYFYELETYKSVMNKIANIFGKNETAFVICSNEEIDLDFFKGLNVFKGPGHFVADLHSLSLCDYIAGPPSTFSRWASFYGQKPLWQIENAEQNPTVKLFSNVT
ncbi:alpha-1,2-fucosyltransferase [bacterium]|nr:alpha-1,2-fucosyltransferase [bacterium]